jgi:hypothetical protein
MKRPAKKPIPKPAAKAPIPKTAATPPSEPSPFRILKIGNCPSLSGQSTLTYHVGHVEGSTEFLLRLFGNTGGGQFNRDWVPLAALRNSLAEWPEERPITTALLRPLFRARSVNTPAFLLAVLIGEGLVSGGEGNARTTGDPEPFLKAMQALIDAKVDLSPEVPVSPKPS